MTLIQALTDKYPAYAEKLAERFREANGKELDWDSVTKASLARFSEYLQSVVARSTARYYCAMFKSTLALYDDEHPLPKGWRDAFKIKKEDSQQVYLTDSEIKKLMECKTLNENEEYVLLSFLIGCLTGARHSDYIRFSSDNISDGLLRYTSQKTRTAAVVPVAPVLPSLISRFTNLPENKMSDSTFNDTIRRLCRRAGIRQSMKLYRRGCETTSEKWQFVASHTARRSFASNLYLRGCDILSISMMMGHASVDMTKGYIVCGLRELPKAVTDYFNQF